MSSDLQVFILKKPYKLDKENKISFLLILMQPYTLCSLNTIKRLIELTLFY